MAHLHLVRLKLIMCLTSFVVLCLLSCFPAPLVSADSAQRDVSDTRLSQNIEEEEDPWAEEKKEEDSWAEEETEEDPWGDSEDADDEWEETTSEEAPWAEEEESAEAAPWEQAADERPSRLDFSGKFYNRISHDTSEDGPFEDDAANHAELILEGVYEAAPGIDLMAGVDIDDYRYVNSGDWDHETTVRPHQVYARFSDDWYQLTLGNQFVRWGKIDQVSPLDIVNPEDIREGFVRPREDRKLPIPMVDLRLYKGVYRFEAIFIPFFYESKLDLVGRDWAMFRHYDRSTGSFHIDEGDPSNDLDNSEYGFRFAGTHGKFDYAFLYFRTREDLPSIDSLETPPGFRVEHPQSVVLEDLVTFAVLTGQPISIDYMQQDVFGFEFETTWRDFGIRGDVAYIDDRYFLDDRLRRTGKPAFQYALGIDYNKPGSHYINFQFSQQFIRDFEDTLLFADEVTSTINGTLRKEFWNSKLALELRYLYNFTRDDYYLNPYISLTHWSDFVFQLGAEIEGGPEDSTLGIYDDNDEVYFVVQYHF